MVGLLFLKVFTADGMFTCTMNNENLKSISSYEAQLETPLFKQLFEKPVLTERIIL